MALLTNMITQRDCNYPANVALYDSAKMGEHFCHLMTRVCMYGHRVRIGH